MLRREIVAIALLVLFSSAAAAQETVNLFSLKIQIPPPVSFYRRQSWLRGVVPPRGYFTSCWV